MNKLRGPILSGVLLLIARHSAIAQAPPPMTCNANASVPPIVRAEGKAELVSDIVLVCTGGNPAAPAPLNISIFLNTNITSNLTGPGPDETEALVLIDEPQPAPTLNLSNGIPFVGQVKGTPGIIVSGNVFTGMRTGGVNQVVFPGVPVVPPGAGTRIFRITNLRALPPPSGTAPANILAFVAISGPIPVAIPSPVMTVGFVSKGLNFSFAPLGVGLRLKFTESFASAFKKRIENGGGPLAPVKQNVPGVIHCTESGFNPDFTPVTPGATGSANTGTRFVAKITGIPFGVAFVIVPNDVVSGSGQLVAARIAPPYAPPFASGVPIVAGGLGAVPVAAGTATILYEVVAAAPYAAVNGCVVIDTFLVTANPWPFGSLAASNATGSFAPVDPTAIISGPAPEPRFN
jgi:hypothetical protein